MRQASAMTDTLPDTLPPPARPITVTTPDGLAIQAHAHGPEAPGPGADLLFIHGFSQCGLCWQAQTTSPLLADLRMVTYDFRGHGASDKPEDPAFYQEPGRWADELEAVIAQTGLVRPVLVGWSYAGRIMGDYLAAKGAAGVGGLVFVDAATRNDRHFYGTCNRLMRLMCAPDLATNVEATRTFLRACFAGEIGRDLFETLLAVNMMVPPKVRAALFGRPADYDTLFAGLDLPTLVIQGALDQVVDPAMARHISNTIVNAQHLELEGIGHAPFLEAPDTFNSALAQFARAVTLGQAPPAHGPESLESP